MEVAYPRLGKKVKSFFSRRLLKFWGRRKRPQNTKGLAINKKIMVKKNRAPPHTNVEERAVPLQSLICAHKQQDTLHWIN